MLFVSKWKSEKYRCFTAGLKKNTDKNKTNTEKHKSEN